MKHHPARGAGSPVLIADWVWDLAGACVVVSLGWALLQFFAIGSAELRLALGLGGYLLGTCLVLASRWHCPLHVWSEISLRLRLARR